MGYGAIAPYHVDGEGWQSRGPIEGLLPAHARTAIDGFDRTHAGQPSSFEVPLQPWAWMGAAWVRMYAPRGCYELLQKSRSGAHLRTKLTLAMSSWSRLWKLMCVKVHNTL